MRASLVRVLLAAALVYIAAGCGDEITENTYVAADTQTITEQMYPPCSPTNPFGTCEADGQTCFEGACVDAATLCSAANPTGTCAADATCFEGVCLPAVLLCSAANPTGLCGPGQVCLQGTCGDPPEPVDPTDECGPANIDGPCPTGQTCFGGVCVAEAALCSATNQTGACGIGQTCLAGDCVDSAGLCSGVNPAGTCPGDLVCTGGLCLPAEVVPPDPCTVAVYDTQPTIDARVRDVLTVDGLQFKDLNDDGQLNPYEDWRLLEICRAEDLVGRMTLAQKIGLMSEGSRVGSGTADGTIPDNVRAALLERHERYALIRVGQRSAAELAVYLNAVQELVEAEAHGIPVTITADPLHGFGLSTDATTGAQSVNPSSVVSPWPYPLGLGAINDAAVTRQYGDVVRHEFMAMGFRWQLGPMADMGTEPRWARVQNVFGENPYHVSIHVAACISGFQGVDDGGLRNGIAATMKHFPGAGANEDGMDSHSYPGRFNVYPGDNFEHHLLPFQAAVDVGVAAVMPCYSVFKDQTDLSFSQLGSAFCHGLISDLLKEELGFTGMVTADWGALGQGYNAESVSRIERAAMFLHAGSHQLGSDSESIFQEAYDAGAITEDDIDEAAAKILEMTFKLGLFEDPYVDPAAPGVRSEENLTNGFIAQKKAIVVLDNRAHEFPPAATGWGAPPDTAPKYLPIDGSRYIDANENGAPDADEYIDDVDGDGVIRVYYDGVVDGLVEDPEKPDAVTEFVGEYDYTAAGTATALPIEEAATPAEADIAVLRITARKGVYFGMDAGVPLSFDGAFPGSSMDSTIAASIKDRNRVLDVLRVRDGYTDADGNAVAAANPDLRIVLVMHMDRPGIVEPFIKGLLTLDELSGEPGSYPLVADPANTDPTGLTGVDAFLVEFGAFDRAVLDVIFNQNAPDGWTYGSAILPMEIPSSDAAVEAQFEDVPNDSKAPTFQLGTGLRY